MAEFCGPYRIRCLVFDLDPAEAGNATPGSGSDHSAIRDPEIVFHGLYFITTLREFGTQKDRFKCGQPHRAA